MFRVARFFVKKDQLVEMNKSMFFQISIDLLLLSFANNSISFDDLFETSTFSSFDDLLETSTFSFEALNLKFSNRFSFTLKDDLEFNFDSRCTWIFINCHKKFIERAVRDVWNTRENNRNKKRFYDKTFKTMHLFDECSWRMKEECSKKKKLIIEKCLIFLKQTYMFNKFCYYHMRWLISNLNLMTN